MAVQESDKDDLMRQATAYDRRLELRLADHTESIFVGFRSDERFSIFWGADPVYHFDPRGRLRRSFVRGHLYRTQGTTLSRLTRRRSPGQSTLLRHDLTKEELENFLQSMDEHLATLVSQLQSGQVRKLGQIPATPDLIPTLQNALQQVLGGQNRLAAIIKA